MSDQARFSYGKKGKKPGRVGSLAAFSDVLPQLCQSLELDKKVNELALLALWPQQVTAVMGQSQVAQQSRAVRLRKQGYQMVLAVKVANAALASEMSFHLPALIGRLNAFKAQTGLTVDRIQLTVGNVNHA